MRIFISATALFISWINISAQEFKADISYKYMYSSQWDKAVQTYNVSRPFITEKQPLFMNGLNTSVSYIFNSIKNIKHGINLSYSYFRSSADNENLENTLNLHFFNLGYILHYENAEKLKGLYSDLAVSALSSVLFRKLNGKQFEFDDTKSKAFGFGGDIGLKLGYYFSLNNKVHLSPFIAMAYTPYLYSPSTEMVVNQTKELTSKNWTGILTSKVGFAIHLRQ